MRGWWRGRATLGRCKAASAAAWAPGLVNKRGWPARGLFSLSALWERGGPGVGGVGAGRVLPLVARARNEAPSPAAPAGTRSGRRKREKWEGCELARDAAARSTPSPGGLAAGLRCAAPALQAPSQKGGGWHGSPLGLGMGKKGRRVIRGFGAQVAAAFLLSPRPRPPIFLTDSEFI